MDFLQVIETLKQDEASVKRLFEGEGTRAGTSKQKANDPKYLQRLLEAAKLVARVSGGSLPFHYFSEAMSTSDFPLLFGDLVDRQILAAYRQVPTTWQAFVRRQIHRDFRPHKIYTPDNAGGTPLGRVHELEEYPEAALKEGTEISYTVKKHGRRMPFSWEAFINDNMDMFREIPERLGRAASRTEERQAVELFVASTGPIAPFFSAGNGNLITNALSINGLQAGLNKLTDRVDDDGNPIAVEAAVLVIPTALEITAQNILNATEFEMDASGFGGFGGTGVGRYKAVNWLRNRVKVVVNPYLSIINTTNGATSWYLFADPDNGRPALQMGFLRGHEEPQTFIKDPNARRVGGGAVNPEEGDFDTDSIEYKIRHVLGGTRVDPKSAVASTGTV